jgi:hypothetical protein
MPLPDITKLLASAQEAFDLSASTAKESGEISFSQQAMTEQIARAQIAEGQAKATVIAAEQAGQLQSQAARLKAGAAFGADLNQQGERISELAMIQNQTQEARLALSQSIAAKQSVSFLDNPLEYVVNQFTVGGDISKFNALADVEDTVTKNIEDITRLSSAVAQNQKNFEVTVTQASADAKAQEALLNAEQQATATRIVGQNYNLAALKATMDASKEQMGIRFSVNQALNAQESQRLQMANHELAVQEAKYRKEDREEKKQTDGYLASRIIKGYQVFYGDKAADMITPGDVKQMVTLMKSGTPAGQEATRAFMAGESNKVAGSPAQVIDMIGRGLPIQFTPAQTSVKGVFEKAVAEVRNRGMLPKDDAERQQIMNLEVNKILSKMSKEVKAGDGENIFQIPDVKLVMQDSAVASTPFVQKILSTSQVDVNNPKMVYNEALRGVKEGKLTVDQAVEGVLSVYQKGVALNIDSKNLPRLGIAPSTKDLKLNDYNTPIETSPGALFGGSKTVNLTDRTAVTRAMLETLRLTYTPKGLVQSIGAGPTGVK